MLKQDSQENWIDLRKPALKGLATIDDPSEIVDNEVSDIVNIVFDDGVATPRGGSVLWADKPSGETQNPLQMMVATTSDGIKYVIAVYGNNFYLRDETNSRWLLLNHTYTPASTTDHYGNLSWNNGRADDRFYFCNGVNNFARWDISLDMINGARTAGATTVTVDDATRFPTTGTLVITDGSTTITAAYTSHTGTVFTLTGALSANVADNSSITVQMVEKSGMEKGKILVKWQRRLVVGNRYGGESNFYYSNVDDPEDFSTGSGISDGGFFQLADGNGGITGLHDFGTYILIEKQDSLVTFDFQINATLSSKLEHVQPLISGFSMGPLNAESTIKVLNSLYYPTESNGISQLDPAVTGSNATTGVSNLSSRIFNYVNDLNFDNARVAYADQKIFWACSTGTVNNIILVYDLIRQAWTKFDSWNAKDIFSKSDVFYYLSRIDGKIYQGLVGQNDVDTPFLSYFYTKRYNFGKPSVPKTADVVYIEGYMTDATEFFVDVIYNELGRLATRTYQINVDTDGLFFAPLPVSSLGLFPMGLLPLGLIPVSQIGSTGIFRGYLSIPNQYGFYNIQLKFYSLSASARWAITGYSVAPNINSAIPSLMKINPND